MLHAIHKLVILRFSFLNINSKFSHGPQCLFLIITTNFLLVAFYCVCSSFNDKPINEETVNPMFCELFEKEQDDLLMDLVDIPKKACDRRVCMLMPFMIFIILEIRILKFYL